MPMKPFIIAARFKYLLLLPFVVILPLATLLAVLTRPHDYTSVAKVLFQEFDPAIFSTINTNGSASLSLGQNRANELTELLATDSFALSVAGNAELRIDTTDAQAAALNTVRKGTTVTAEGRDLLDIEHKASSATAAQTITRAILDTYMLYVNDTTRQTLTQAIAFDQQNVDSAQKTLQDAQTALAGYHASSPLDPQSNSLAAGVQTAQLALNSASSKLRSDTQLRDSPATQKLVNLTDNPSLPTAPDAVKKTSLLIFPGAGLLLAISLSAALYGFLLRTDNNIRVAEDLQALQGLLLLGSVPDVSKLKKRAWPRHFFRLAVTALGSTVSQR